MLKLELKQKLIVDSYNKRIVRYEDIHNLPTGLIDKFLKLVKINEFSQILDHGCGYGAVTRIILENYNNLYVHLQDTSSKQIERAICELENLTNSKKYFYDKSLIDCAFDYSKFDLIFSKLVFQEMKLKEQLVELNELFRIIKPNSNLLIWILWLDEEADFFRDTIRFKDKISGLTSMYNNRYFAKKDEFIDLIKCSSFRNSSIEIIELDKMLYSTKNQLNGDLKNSPKKINRLNDFIRLRLSKESNIFKNMINYEDRGNDINFSIKQVAIKLVR